MGYCNLKNPDHKEKLKMRCLAIAMTLVLAFIAVNAQAAPLTDPMGGTGGGPINGSLHVTVVQDGSTTPIEGAFVMAGIKPGKPFANNWGFTDANGEIDFSHAGLSGPLMVTAGAAGYQYFSLVSVDANDIVIPLEALASAPTTYEVGDFVSGIDVNNGLFNSGDGNVDLAFVLTAMTIEDILSFDMDSMLGPMELMEVLGQQFEVPSNLFIPEQYELFTLIEKDHYTIYLPGGNHTLCALSCRAALTDLQNMTEITDLIPNLGWREIDILNVNVTGNTNGADLNVGPDLSQTVTMQLSNLPENSTAWCVSLGDLDGMHGLGRVVPLGLNSVATPAGGPGSGTVGLSTTAASGEFAGMDYHPVVAVQVGDSSSSQLLVIADRTSHSQTYTVSFSNFFDLLNLNYARGYMRWNDVTNPGTGSPDVDVHLARFVDDATGNMAWEFVVKGDVQRMVVPFLPAAAPAPLTGGAEYSWEHASLGLTYDMTNFDFDAFAFTDIYAHGSHLSVNNRNILWPKHRLAPQSAVPLR